MAMKIFSWKYTKDTYVMLEYVSNEIVFVNIFKILLSVKVENQMALNFGNFKILTLKMDSPPPKTIPQTPILNYCDNFEISKSLFTFEFNVNKPKNMPKFMKLLGITLPVFILQCSNVRQIKDNIMLNDTRSLVLHNTVDLGR